MSCCLNVSSVKLYLEIENNSDIATLQQSIDKFVNLGTNMAIIAIFPKVLSYDNTFEKIAIRVGLLASKNPVDYHTDRADLNTVDKVRDLGIYIDSKLTFVEHINMMVAKAHRRANQILRCFLSR